MNDKFFKLPKEKQHQIINAGYRVLEKSLFKKSKLERWI